MIYYHKGKEKPRTEHIFVTHINDKGICIQYMLRTYTNLKKNTRGRLTKDVSLFTGEKAYSVPQTCEKMLSKISNQENIN